MHLVISITCRERRDRLKHYAGDVTYDVTDFVKKNVDALSRDLSLVMYRCDLPLMKALFPEGEM